MPIHLLVVNNDAAEAGAIQSRLESDMRIPWCMSHCTTIREAQSRVRTTDLIILKPEMEGILTPKEVFQDIENMVFEIPILVLVNQGDERGFSTYVMEQGAADIIIRGQFSRLVDAIEFSLIRQRISSNARKTANKTLFESQGEGKVALKNSQDRNIAREERHKQILRMFGGDYTVDQHDKSNA